MTTFAQKIANGQAPTIDDTRAYITDTSPRTSAAVFSGTTGFQKSKVFLNYLENPQDAVPSIHIAGTSGKGSTATILTELLIAHGFTVGAYTSPHVYNLNERWCINGKPISDDDLIAATRLLFPAAEALAKTKWGRPSYFEITTAIGFIVNKTKHVDYAVIETGFGGLLDTTNTITRSDKLAVITQLGLDHTEILGNTLPEIAAQKAGILTRNGSAIMLQNNDPAVQSTIESIAKERGTHITLVTQENYEVVSILLEGTVFNYASPNLKLDKLVVSLYGEHQAQNAAMALRSLEALAQRDGFTLQEAAIRRALAGSTLPGRFEHRSRNGSAFILDGSHNPQKIGALVNTLRALLPSQKFNWIVAFGKNKDALESLKLVAPLVETLYVTSFFANQDMPLSSKGMDVTKLANLARTAGITKVEIEPDTKMVLERAAKDQTKPVVVSGSFYLLGELFSL